MTIGDIRAAVRILATACVATALMVGPAVAQDDGSPDGTAAPSSAPAQSEIDMNVSDAAWLLKPLDPMSVMADPENATTILLSVDTNGEVIETIAVEAQGCLWSSPVHFDESAVWLTSPTFFASGFCIGRFPIDGSEPQVLKVEETPSGDQVQPGALIDVSIAPISAAVFDGQLYFTGHVSTGVKVDAVDNGLYRFDPDARSIELVAPDIASVGRAGDKLFLGVAPSGKTIDHGNILAECGDVQVLDAGAASPRKVGSIERKKHCPWTLQANDQVVAIVSPPRRLVLLDPQTEAVTGELGKKAPQVRTAMPVDGEIWAAWFDKKSKLKHGLATGRGKLKLKSDRCMACAHPVVATSPGAVWTQEAPFDPASPVRRIDTATREVTLELDLSELGGDASAEG